QHRLTPVNIAGNPAYRIVPKRDDFYRRLIDLRRKVWRSRCRLLPNTIYRRQRGLKNVWSRVVLGSSLSIHMKPKARFWRTRIRTSCTPPRRVPPDQSRFIATPYRPSAMRYSTLDLMNSRSFVRHRPTAWGTSILPMETNEPERDSGVLLWQEDLWRDIVSAA